MNRIMLSLILLGFSVIFADDDSNNHAFSQGVEAYRNGDYETSLEAFQSIEAQSYESWELYYNIGNIYYKKTEYGHSILYYRKAQKLMPKHEDIGYNIELTRLHFKDKIEKTELMPLVEMLKSVRKYPSLETLAWFSVVFWLILAFIFSIKIFNIKKIFGIKLSGLTTLIIVILLTVGSSGWFIYRVKSSSEKNMVILKEESSVMSAPLHNSKVLFKLHEGAEGKIINTANEWMEFKLDDGKNGWIHESEIGIY